jgi:hypothetical protein
MTVTYVVSQRAQERYYREEGIPAKPLPDLVSNDDVLARARSYERCEAR